MHASTKSRARRAAGLSLVELLVALAISAMLLTATTVALDASFRAYASAAESASTQAATRMVVQRVLLLVRTGSAQGPLTTGDASAYVSSLSLENPVINGDVVTSTWMVLRTPDGRDLLLHYQQDERLIRVTEEPNAASPTWYPLLGGVNNATFTLNRRRGADTNYLWVLQRGSLDLRVEPDTDATLGTEAGGTDEMRFVASTGPRRLE